MYRSLYIIILFFVFLQNYAQQEIENIQDHRFMMVGSEVPGGDYNLVKDSANIKVIDPFYREDQFYIAVTYNLLQNRPSRISQNRFSTGFHFGFLRDMPVNKARTYSIAAGLGFSINNLNQNLKISETNGAMFYEETPRDLRGDRNRLALHYLELPIELRWRTSTYDSHKFWRIYTGFKLSYLVADRSTFVGGGVREIVKGNKDLNQFHYGIYTAFGYNTWNFHVYYGLNPLFKSGTVNSESIGITTINMGLMFYIL